MVGSLCGGTKLSIYGNGFSFLASETSVYLAGQPCTVVMSSNTVIQCVTPAVANKVSSADESHTVSLSVNVQGKAVPVPLDVMFNYASRATPVLSTFGPVSGQGADLVTFEGTNFGGSVSITIGNHPCEVKRNDDMFVQCVPQPAPAGMAAVTIYAEGLGNACPGPNAPALQFLYSLSVQTVRSDNVHFPNKGSFGGGGSIVVVGSGFSPSDTITLCDSTLCTKISGLMEDPPQFHQGDPSYQMFKCSPGRLMEAPEGAQLRMTPRGVEMSAGTPPEDYNKTCHLTVTSGGYKASIAAAWTYSHRMTPAIERVARGSDGPGHVEIFGSGFHAVMENLLAGDGMEPVAPGQPVVHVGGTPCKLLRVTDTEIDCQDAVAPPEGAIVEVFVPGYGVAVPTATGTNLIPKPLVAPVTLALGVPRPVPTVVPSKGNPMMNNVNKRCRKEHQLLDCPGGWRCCPNDGEPEVKPLPALQGICAPVCLSLLQRPKK
jgi:hypothetical protein